MRSHPRARRRAFLVLPALLAAATLSALLALGAPGGGPAIADAHTMDRGHHAVPAREVALRQDMRTLWQEHIVWTRQVIVDFAADLPGLSASASRLLRNQTDIGDAIAPFYGKAAASA